MEHPPTYKLRARIGPCEFDADGPAAEVVAQFEAWRQLVSSEVSLRWATAPSQHRPLSTTPLVAAITNGNGNAHAPNLDQGDATHTPDAVAASPTEQPDSWLNIFDATSRFGALTLKVFPDGKTARPDAVLLMAYGYRRLRRYESTPATQLADSLRVSGFNLGPRIDRAAEALLESGLLLRTGRAKATRYRLTNTGAAKAETIAKGLAEKL